MQSDWSNARRKFEHVAFRRGLFTKFSIVCFNIAIGGMPSINVLFVYALQIAVSRSLKYEEMCGMYALLL